MLDSIDQEVKKTLNIVDLLGELERACDASGISFVQIAPIISLILDHKINTKEEVELVFIGFKEGLKK